MASHQAFNSMMEEFLNELIETFPEEKSLKVQQNAFQTLKKSNSKKVVQVFMNSIAEYSNYITNKDEKVFDLDIEFLKKINIKKLWTKELSQNTKDAIWQYLQTLVMLGTTITSIPSDILQSIEGVAEQCANQMDSDNGVPDMGSLFSGLQNIMQGMNKNK